jgi:outer membrane protein TolC
VPPVSSRPTHRFTKEISMQDSYAPRHGALKIIVLAAMLASPLAAAEALTLAAAQRLAVERSRQIDARASAAVSSREMARAAGELPDPVVRLGLDNLPVDGADRFSVARDFMTMRRIGIAQEFTGEAKRALRRERYEREADGADAERQAAIAAVQRDTAVAWLDRYYLDAMRGAAADYARASQAEVDAGDSAYRAGRGTQGEVFAARAAAALARDREADVERRLRVARIDLARRVGGDGSQALTDLPDMSRVAVEGEALERHLGSHPEIVALDRKAEAADAQARLAAEAKRPDWTWEAAYQQRGPAFGNMVSIGVSIPWPWDAANRQDREAAARRAMAEEARATRDEMLRDHIAEVAALIEQWRVGRERQARFRGEILPDAHGRAEATLAAYAGGKSTLAEVLAARRGEFELRMQSLELDLEVARAWARLAFLLPDTDARASVHHEARQ